MDLVRPDRDHLDGFVDALRRGWSPSTEHDVAAEILAELDADTDAFLAGLDDRDPQGRTVTLPDGTAVPRIPGFARWMWDGEFCGSINARWQPGTTDLPPTCLGHIGYSVVPWKQRRGYATRALALVLDELRAETDLPWVEITTDVDNVASQKVMAANGAGPAERFDKGAAYGHGDGLRYRIPLR
jgi:predicted acetyltransferase